jgi:hypothetical protein
VDPQVNKHTSASICRINLTTQEFALNLLIELKAENSFEEKCWFQKRT